MAKQSTVHEAPLDEGLTTPRPTRGQKVKAHFKKFWWAYLIGLIVVVLVVLLPMFVHTVLFTLHLANRSAAYTLDIPRLHKMALIHLDSFYHKHRS